MSKNQEKGAMMPIADDDVSKISGGTAEETTENSQDIAPPASEETSKPSKKRAWSHYWDEKIHKHPEAKYIGHGK